MPLQHYWQGFSLITLLLYPVSLLFRCVVACRHFFYHVGLLRSTRLPVPVIVVGNCVVGGTGKTPVVIWLVEYLRANGWKPGVISRGYGTREVVHAVMPTDSPAEAGDEPLLIARRTHCPVWIGADRVAAAHAVLEAHPECNVLVSDDGLQHYSMARDIELAVFDTRSVGNGQMLPAGPWREPSKRLRSVDAVLAWNGVVPPEATPKRTFSIGLRQPLFRSMQQGGRVLDVTEFMAQFAGRPLFAIAGIANPERFFSMLRDVGLSPECHAFPDHYKFTASDLEFGINACVLMTEKDAVKCTQFASVQHWVVCVDALPEPKFGAFILEKLGAAKTA